MELRVKQVLCIMVSVFAILGAPSIFTTENNSYSLGVTTKYPFENSTHIQYTNDGDTVLKPSISFYLPLVRDPEGIAFSGEPFKPIGSTLSVSINQQDKLTDYEFDYTDSGSKQVSISDTQIYPSFSFKMPLDKNGTSLSIQNVNQFFNVYQIENSENATTYYASSNQPLSVNGSVYDYPYATFEVNSDGRSSVSIMSFADPIPAL